MSFLRRSTVNVASSTTTSSTTASSAVTVPPLFLSEFPPPFPLTLPSLSPVTPTSARDSAAWHMAVAQIQAQVKAHNMTYAVTTIQAILRGYWRPTLPGMSSADIVGANSSAIEQTLHDLLARSGVVDDTTADGCGNETTPRSAPLRRLQQSIGSSLEQVDLPNHRDDSTLPLSSRESKRLYLRPEL